MEKKGIILIGGGGHCKSVIDVIEVENKFRIVGILDLPEKIGSSVSGYPVIGTDDNAKEWVKKGVSFHISLGHIKSALPRIRIYEKLKQMNAHLPVICSPTSYISSGASVEEGTIIMHHVLLNSGATIGKNCIINNKALIEHDSKIGDHCHISTASTINGDCHVSTGTFIGSNSTLIQGIIIKENCVIGAGCVVTHNVESNKIVVGNPGK